MTTVPQSLDEFVANAVHAALQEHGEVVTTSHLNWLHRQYSRVLVRTLELDARERDLARREHAARGAGRKSRRGGHHSHPSSHDGEP